MLCVFAAIAVYYTEYSHTQKDISMSEHILTPQQAKEAQNRKNVLRPQIYQNLLGAGLDVDFAKTKQGKEFYSEQILKDFAVAGIKHIRIRVMDDISPELIEHMKRVVEDALTHGVIPIIAYQADDYKVNPSRENLENAVAWWTATAEAFQEYSPLLSFDNMIEATDTLNKNPEALNVYHEAVTAAIRESNPERIVFISPSTRSEPEQLHLLIIPSAHNGFVMTEFHFYASGPSRHNPKKKWTTGTEAEKDLIREKIRIAKEWGRAHDMQLWVGAWMPGDYNDKNDSEYSIDEQVRFATFVSCELQKNGIPYAVNSDTKFYDREQKTWIPAMAPVLRAVVTPQCDTV